jgi:hypothetical protein
MQSSSERERLIKQMYREPAHPWIAVAMCAVGFAIIALVAVIDISREEYTITQPTSVHAVSDPALGSARGEARRQQGMDER